MGADYITFLLKPLSMTEHKLNKQTGCKPGIVLNPATSVHYLKIIEDIEMILLMSKQVLLDIY